MLIKNFLKFSGIIFLGALIFIIIFVNLPLSEVEILKLTGQQKNIFFYFNVGSNVQKIFNFSKGLKFNQKTLVKRNLTTRFVVRGTKLFSPLKLIVMANFKEEEKSPDYVILLKSRKVVRLSQVFSFCLKKVILGKSEGVKLGEAHIYAKKTIDDPDEINAYAIFKDCFILSNNYFLVEKAIKSLSFNKVISQDKALLSKLQAHQDGALLFVNNKKGKVSKIIEKAEEKSYYSFFPNIKDVECIYAYADFKTDNFISGNLVYFFSNLESMNSGKEDVEFLLKIIKRFFMANRVDFKMSSFGEGRMIKFNYKIKKEEKK